MSEDELRQVEAEPKLPRAPVEKVISEVLPPNMSCNREVKQIILNSCAEFLHMVATEANEVCEREGKKTITNEHVCTALWNLGYGEYVEPCGNSYREHVEQTRLRPSKQDKFKESGLTQAELEREQEELFKKARLALEREQEGTIQEDVAGPRARTEGKSSRRQGRADSRADREKTM
jgi:down-regulator of transcription 1